MISEPTERERFRLRGRSSGYRGSSEAVSSAGRATEKDANRSAGVVKLWRSSASISSRRQRRTPLGRRLEEIRERIKASGEPLLSSWEEIDRELGERRSRMRNPYKS